MDKPSKLGATETVSKISASDFNAIKVLFECIVIPSLTCEKHGCIVRLQQVFAEKPNCAS